MNINNSKKHTIPSNSATPNKNKPNDAYFNSQDKLSLNQNLKPNQNVNNNPSNLKMNLNNLMNNPIYNQNIPHPVSTGNLIGNFNGNNGIQKPGSTSSKSLQQKNVNNNETNFVNKFINSYK